MWLSGNPAPSLLLMLAGSSTGRLFLFVCLFVSGSQLYTHISLVIILEKKSGPSLVISRNSRLICQDVTSSDGVSRIRGQTWQQSEAFLDFHEDCPERVLVDDFVNFPLIFLGFSL